MGYIIKFLVERPLFERLILIFIIVVAIVSAFQIKRLAYPRVDFERLSITTLYPGASPEDVELNVTIKLEEALKEIEGIEKYKSSSIENMSIIDVFIDPDAEDKENVKSEVRRAIDSVGDLPGDVKENPNIFEHKMENYPIYEVSLTIPSGDEKTLRFHARQLKKKLLELGSVSKIWNRGIRDREFKILLNREKMSSYEISFDEVILAIKQNRLRVSGGFVESFAAEKGLITISEFDRPEDVENIIVRTSEMGSYQIKVRDIGSVVDGFVKRDVIVRDNGKEGISLWATKKKRADILAVTEEIKKVIADYKKNYAPEDLSIETTFDESIETRNRLYIVYSNALAGFVLVIIVLFFFLDKRIAFWTAFGIPISIGITIIVLNILDITINSISLCGIVVVLGMVVDDAIIISESIYRSRENGMEPTRASIYGLMMVIRPVIGTILTTMIAFFPIYFVPGIIGDFSLEIPTIVIVMLTASFIEAAFILPVHLAHGKNSNPKKMQVPPGQRLFLFFENYYARALEKALKYKFPALMLMLLFVFAGGTLTYFITNFNMFPVDQAYRMWVYGKCPKESNLEFTARETLKLEEIIEGMPKGVVHSYKTTVGRFFNENGRASNSFFTRLILTPSTTRDMTANDVKEYIGKEFKKKNIDSISEIKYYIDGGGPPVGKPLELMIIGNENDLRKKIIEDISRELRSYGVIDIDSDLREGKEEIKVLPRHDIIAVANLNVASIAGTIRSAYDGTIVTHMQTPDDKIDFRVVLDNESKDYVDPLKGLRVKNPYGKLVPLKSLVYERKGYSPQNIFHYNGDRVNALTGNVDLEKTTPKDVYSRIKEDFRDFEKKYPGFRMIIGGEASESAKMYRFFVNAIIISIVAIYFLLVLQFNSFVQPIMVILAIPFGLVGLMLAFGIHGIDLSLLAMMGILGFAGVVVNDSLIMVDFINRALSGDKSISEVLDMPLRREKLTGTGKVLSV